MLCSLQDLQFWLSAWEEGRAGQTETNLQYQVVISNSVVNGKQSFLSSLYSCPPSALVQHSQVQSVHILKSLE